MVIRTYVILLATLPLAACSHGHQSEAQATDATTASTSTMAGDTLEIPVHPLSADEPGKFASRAELEWAAAWMSWHKRFEPLLDRSDSILSVPERRERAIAPGSKDNETLQRAVRAFRSCSEDAVARGAPPSTRLEEVAVETGAVCERVEKAGARLEEEGFQIGFPAEAILANSHLQDAIGEAWSFMPGLDFGVPIAEGPSRRTRTQIRYTLAASRLVGEQVTVTCYSPAAWRRNLAEHHAPRSVAGFVEVHGAAGNLAPIVCRWLDRLVYGGARPEELSAKAQAAHALLVLSHEAQHARGVHSEPKADCYGMQMMARLGRLLHVSGSYSDELAEFFWTRMYPYERASYRSDECRPTGKLDLHPHSSAWP